MNSPLLDMGSKRSPSKGIACRELISMDSLTPERRSWNMSRIRGVHTAPEIAVRRLLHRMGFRFRLHVKQLPGRPDIVLAKHRTVIFVHGCFWHRHRGCANCTTPTNAATGGSLNSKATPPATNSISAPYANSVGAPSLSGNARLKSPRRWSGSRGG